MFSGERSATPPGLVPVELARSLRPSAGVARGARAVRRESQVEIRDRGAMMTSLLPAPQSAENLQIRPIPRTPRVFVDRDRRGIPREDIPGEGGSCMDG